MLRPDSGRPGLVRRPVVRALAPLARAPDGSNPLLPHKQTRAVEEAAERKVPLDLGWPAGHPVGIVALGQIPTVPHPAAGWPDPASFRQARIGSRQA